MSISSPKMQNHVQNIRDNIRTIPKVRNQLMLYVCVGILYAGMHVYLAFRSYQSFSPSVSKSAMGLLIGSLGLLFPYAAATLDQGPSNKPVSRFFAYAGYYWAAMAPMVRRSGSAAGRRSS